MANLSDHAENLALNFLMGGAAATAPVSGVWALDGTGAAMVTEF